MKYDYQNLLEQCCNMIFENLEIDEFNKIYDDIILLIEETRIESFEKVCDLLFILFNETEFNITNQIQIEKVKKQLKNSYKKI